ncbi:hypothetical protein LSTR_LSTR009997 [Laodelphax striatellus]|uniref:SEC7 domain-containing protein n=1 Tax=Laodelphax striatellus TaxID=195883 RepID=A0A482WWD7_LAOST|nr:hypothetical protein LSTR_LSTR009997 [Laodelphax striatellus]
MQNDSRGGTMDNISTFSMVVKSTARTSRLLRVFAGGRGSPGSGGNEGWFSSLKRSATGKSKKNNRLTKSAWDINAVFINTITAPTTMSILSLSPYAFVDLLLADCSKNHTRTKQTSIGRKKFNMDPKKGIEYLLEHGLLQATADHVAAFLYKGEGLNKTAIGDYLGERSDFNEKVGACHNK